jgi:hypothetical protein
MRQSSYLLWDECQKSETKNSQEKKKREVFKEHMLYLEDEFSSRKKG